MRFRMALLLHFTLLCTAQGMWFSRITSSAASSSAYGKQARHHTRPYTGNRPVRKVPFEYQKAEWRQSIASNCEDFHWVQNAVKEALQSQSDPEIQTMDQVLQTLDNYLPDRTQVAFLNRLLKLARQRRLDWLILMLQQYQKANRIPMTQTWKSGLQIRKPRRPIPE